MKISVAHIVLALIAGMLLSRCAQELNPTGGARDETSPEVVKTSPPSESLEIDDNRIKVWFNEPITRPDIKQDIFISPFVNRPQAILSDNGKRLTIDLEEDLLPQTTYVITLNGIKDLNERNPIEPPYTLAFSTGDQLDSLAFQGQIVDTKGEGIKEMLVLLFDADSAIGNDILNRRPTYLTRTDDQGNFSFRFLRENTYRVFGLSDQDQSNTWNIPNEAVAIPKDSLLVVSVGDTLSTDSTRSDSGQVADRVRLVSFVVDETAPRLRRYFWTNETTLAIQISEAIRLSETEIFATDTARTDTTPVSIASFVPGSDPELWVHLPAGRRWLDLHLVGFQDSLGNRKDSILRVSPDRRRLWETPLSGKPSLDLAGPFIEFLPQRYVTVDDRRFFSLTDTSSVDSVRQVFEVEWSHEGMTQQIRPILSDSAIGKLLVLRIDRGFFYVENDSSATDTVFTYQANWLKPDAYGTLSGRVIPDTTYDGPLVLRLIGPKGPVRTFTDTTFSFQHLEAGDYSFDVIYDADGNGILTTGSLKEHRLPERRKMIPGSISIRANWDFDDHVVDLNAEAAPPPEGETPEESEIPDQ